MSIHSTIQSGSHGFHVLTITQEKKQKELEELNAALAELGIDLPSTPGQEAPAASKKKKKNKNVASATSNGSPETSPTETQQPATNGAAADSGNQQEEEEPVQLVDPAEARKALAAKKKAASGGGKSATAAAKAAAEAKARAKKLASKKDKSHYNQVWDGGTVCVGVAMAHTLLQPYRLHSHHTICSFTGTNPIALLDDWQPLICVCANWIGTGSMFFPLHQNLSSRVP